MIEEEYIDISHLYHFFNLLFTIIKLIVIVVCQLPLLFIWTTGFDTSLLNSLKKKICVRSGRLILFVSSLYMSVTDYSLYPFIIPSIFLFIPYRSTTFQPDNRRETHGSYTTSYTRLVLNVMNTEPLQSMIEEHTHCYSSAPLYLTPRCTLTEKHPCYIRSALFQPDHRREDMWLIHHITYQVYCLWAWSLRRRLVDHTEHLITVSFSYTYPHQFFFLQPPLIQFAPQFHGWDIPSVEPYLVSHVPLWFVAGSLCELLLHVIQLCPTEFDCLEIFDLLELWPNYWDSILGKWYPPISWTVSKFFLEQWHSNGYMIIVVVCELGGGK